MNQAIVCLYLAKEFGMAKSTISTILKYKYQLKASDVAKESNV